MVFSIHKCVCGCFCPSTSELPEVEKMKGTGLSISWAWGLLSVVVPSQILPQEGLGPTGRIEPHRKFNAKGTQLTDCMWTAGLCHPHTPLVQSGDLLYCNSFADGHWTTPHPPRLIPSWLYGRRIGGWVGVPGSSHLPTSIWEWVWIWTWTAHPPAMPSTPTPGYRQFCGRAESPSSGRNGMMDGNRIQQHLEEKGMEEIQWTDPYWLDILILSSVKIRDVTNLCLIPLIKEDWSISWDCALGC